MAKCLTEMLDLFISFCSSNRVRFMYFEALRVGL